MLNKEVINFKNFYVIEFFKQVGEKIEQQFNQQNISLIHELIDHLNAEDDINIGIEKIAKEQGSGELSIFLFDIFDRIEDYPPSLVYDALPEVVDDFVSGLALMIDEDETRNAIKIINEQFAAAGEKVIEREEITSDELILEDQAQKEEKAAQELFDFEQFVELEFNDLIQNKMIQDLSDEEAAKFFYFSQIIRSDLDFEISDKTPGSVKSIVSIIKSIFPWKIGESYRVEDVLNSLRDNLDELVSSMIQLDEETPMVIQNSLEEGRIIIPEVKERIKFVKEEIPEEPTTIDNLLSEYFQSDVNDYTKRFKENVTSISQNPEDPSLVRELMTKFQSFKEICMIHGYVLLEQFCKDMLDLLTQSLKKKKSINPTALKYFHDFYDLLNNTDKLKDPREKTEEMIRLQDLPQKFETAIFIAQEEIIEEPDEKMITEKFPQEGVEEIAYSDQERLISILGDILSETNERMHRYLTEDFNIKKTNELITTLKGTCQLLNRDDLVGYFSALEACLEKISKLNAVQQSKAAREVYQVHYSLIENFAEQAKFDEWREKLVSLDLETVAEDVDINFGDKHDLLQILAHIEKANLESFRDHLEKGFVHNDQQEQKKQFNHFMQLKRNLVLIEQKELIAFPEYYCKLFSAQEEMHLNSSMLDEIANSYGLFIESLESGGKGIPAQELVTVLSEVLQEQKVEEPAEEEVQQRIQEEDIESVEVQEEMGEKDQEAEEDLDEIFQQESTTALEKVDEAITILRENVEDRSHYRTIERNIHSLKSSARLMGYNDVSDLAASLEELSEKLSTPNYETKPVIIEVIEEGVKYLRDAVAGNKIDLESILKKIDEIDLVETEQVPDQAEEEKEEETRYQAGLEEKPLFSTTTEEDEDLLDIFKDESSEFIKIVEKANAVLKDDLKNKDALNQLEHASHSLKSAAKMLGFSEIGQIGDCMEMIAETINKGEISNDEEINNNIESAIDFIKKLTAGHKVNPEAIAKTLQGLDIHRIKRVQAQREKSEKVSPGSDIRVSLDNETELFLKEAWELLEKVNQDLVKLEKLPGDQEIMNNLCRNLHTLKGSAQIMQFNKIGAMAHRIEDLFEQFKKSDKGIGENDLDIVFRGTDEIQNLLESIKTGKGETSADYETIISELYKKLGQEEPPKVEKKKEVKKAMLTPEKEKKAFVYQDESEQVIKISTKQLDELVNMAAELVVNKTQLLNYLERLKKIGDTIEQDRIKLRSTDNLLESFLEKHKYEEKGSVTHEEPAEKDKDFNELEVAAKDFKEVLNTLDKLSSNFYSITQNFEQNISQISNLTKHLHDDIMQVRMVPTEFLFNRFPRAVRDLAKKQKKNINLLVEGEDTEMDRAMIESLTDPVMHLIRNAIDHGIETPAERLKKGKDEKGTILLKARRDKNQVIIEVQDDGRGIDPNIIKDVIIKKELASAEDVAQMSTSEILDYVFHPGFSTKDEASDISGRGVGLDVVATHLQKLKGDIRINSTPDQGTAFTIRVPLTLAISQAMLLKLGEEILAVPLTYVEETIQFKEADIVEKKDKKFIQIRQNLIPIVELSRFLRYGPEKKPSKRKSNTAIIILDSGTKYALVVDKLLHREEIVIKALGEQLSKIPYISSGTIFGDGSVALILDISAITKRVEMEYLELETLEEEIKVEQVMEEEELAEEEKVKEEKVKIMTRKKITDRLPAALIIDDSLSVRKFVSSVLERNNYSTVLASDGPEALAKLENENFDIIITDLEMPKMHGFELIEEIRKQEIYHDLPIVILTGRVGKEHKEKGMKLGANAYIVKPFKENDLIKTLDKFIDYKKN